MEKTLSRVRVKFCGITNIDDARVAVALGVDALGFVFYPPSPRYIAPAVAARIIAALPPFVAKVGLFVNAPPAEVESVIAETGIDAVQFHGDEAAADCRRVSRPWIKALRIAEDTDVLRLAADYPEAHALLLDAYDAQLFGGTGRSFDWSRYPADLARPLILAGGLTPDNVAAAIRATAPYAVDVSGGIEARKGVKDIEKMKRFITEVSQLERET